MTISLFKHWWSSPPSHRGSELAPPSEESLGSTATTSPTDTATLSSGQEAQVGPPFSTLRLLFVHIGAALTLFLATTDATIVSTSLPTIASDFGASQAQYTWVGTAYMLTQTAFQPLYGMLSDLVGRKNVLYASMFIFATGSLLCGAAVSIKNLILARALAGIGGGGIVSTVWVLTSEIVEPKSRPKWSQALSVTWSCSAIAGPLLGGLFSTGASTTVNWRWAFYLNLPVCAVAWILIVLSLRDVSFDRAKSATWRSLALRFDFVGLVLFITGTGCVVVGFSCAMDNSWTSPSTLSFIISGPLILVLGGFYEMHTKRDALFPPAAFRSFTVGKEGVRFIDHRSIHYGLVIILVVTFLHNLAFNSGTFYLALYFQAVNGSTPLDAGIQMLPYSLGSSLASVPAAWFIGYLQTKTGDTTGQKWIITVGLLISTIGFGLLSLLDDMTSRPLQVILPLIAGIGIGMLFHAPYQVFSRAMDPSTLAMGTSAFFLVRFTGATVGLAVAGLVYDGTLTRVMPTGYRIQDRSSSIDWTSLHFIEPLSLRLQVLHAVAVSIKMIWVVCVPLLGVALLISLFVKRFPVEGSIGESKENQCSSSERLAVVSEA
ncbi:major facilitator superfamily domain-containing protein [Scleroderma yunnanense]